MSESQIQDTETYFNNRSKIGSSRVILACHYVHNEINVIPAKFHDFREMLTNLKDSHDLTIVF